MITHCPKGHAYDETNTYWQVRKNGHKTPSCRACQRVRYQGNRAYHTIYMRKWRAENRDHAHQTWSELRKSKKAWLDAYKRKQSCAKCGESDVVCLDFHHRDPNEKHFNIAVAIARASIERLQNEVAKCDILCANCHRKLHAAERVAEKVS